MLTGGYISGPAAATEPRRRSLELVERARRIVRVEGVTDQIAVETLAARHELDLAHHGTLVAPIGGAHAIAMFLEVIARRHVPPDVVGGLCDRREAPVFQVALDDIGLSPVVTDDDLARQGYFVCDTDLESELIRSVGPERIVQLMREYGDLGAFRTLQKQAPWQGRPLDAQLHRFLRSKARRMHRYARVLIDALDLEHTPRPLQGVLELL